MIQPSSISPVLSTYHTSHFALYPLTDLEGGRGGLCTSMTFGFYLKGLQDFNHWKNQLIGMSRRYSPQEFIFSLNFQEKRLELEFQ